MRNHALVLSLAVLSLAACSSKSGGTTSSGTGTGSGTGGGTTSGSDVTSCTAISAGGGQAELTDCNFNVDCACPANCTADPTRAAILAEGAANPAGKYCEVPCQTNADCDLPSTVCQAGTCVEIPCGALDDAGARDDFGYPCNALGTNDGTCLPGSVEAQFPNGGGGTSLPLVANGLPAACWLGGTAVGSCTVLAGPNLASERCSAGAVCVASLPWEFSTTGECLPTCDPSPSAPSGAPTCASGQKCIELPLIGKAFEPYGVCTTTGDGGCAGGLPTGQSELNGCYGGESCACSEVCTPLDGGVGVGLATGVCQLPCATSADCSNPTTQCNAGLCGHLPCAGTTCAFGDAGQGTCLPPSFSWFDSAPFCVAAGSQTSGETCSFMAVQAVVSTNSNGLLGPEGLPGVAALPASQACAPGLLCVVALDGGSACAPACTADGGSCGDGGLLCYPLDATGYGFCGMCGVKAAACAFDTQCCSGTCGATGFCQ